MMFAQRNCEYFSLINDCRIKMSQKFVQQWHYDYAVSDIFSSQGELIVYPCLGVGLSVGVHNFKHLLL